VQPAFGMPVLRQNAGGLASRSLRRSAGGAPKIAKGRISETGILPFFLKISTQRIQLRERQPLTTEKYLQPGAAF